MVAYFIAGNGLLKIFPISSGMSSLRSGPLIGPAVDIMNVAEFFQFNPPWVEALSITLEKNPDNDNARDKLKELRGEG